MRHVSFVVALALFAGCSAKSGSAKPNSAVVADGGATTDAGAGGNGGMDAGSQPIDGGTTSGGPVPTVPGTWRWENPLPSGADLNAVWAVASDDVWAAGNAGALLHFDGSAWKSVAAPTSSNLNALWGTGRANLWAAGDQGTLLHYDGAAWTAVTSGTAATLGVISGSAEDDVWVSSAVIPGPNGTPGSAPQDAVLLHFDGRGWTRTSVRGTTAVAAIARDDVWVGTCGAALHFDGKSWTPYGTPQGCVRTIAGLSAGPVFLSNETAVLCHPHSDLPCAGHALMRFDAGAWTAAVGPGATTLTAAFGQLWNCESGYVDTLFRFDGSTWVTLATDSGDAGASMETPWSRALSVAPDGQAWIVGTFGRRKHFDGSTLATVFPEADLLSMAGSSECDVWAVGQEPTATVLRRDCDGNWTRVDLVAAGVIPPMDVRSWEEGAMLGVASAAPDDVWIEDGNGKLLHFDGVHWSTEMAPARGELIAVARGELYLGTSSGLFHRDAAGWESVAAFSQRGIGQISASAPDDVWVLSGGGSARLLLHHFDGTAWSTAVDVGGGVSIRIADSGPNDVWLTGFNGFPSGAEVRHFDGSSWRNVPTPIFDIFLVSSGGAGKLWAEDGSGDFLFDGSSWTNYPSGANPLPQGGFHRKLFHVGHTLFAVGFAGEILSRPDR